LYLTCAQNIYMKHLSITFNIVLLLAVGVLYYLHFSDKRGNKSVDSGNAKNTVADFPGKAPLIAYVEIDSLNNNVTFIKQKQDELNAKQKNIDIIYDNKYKKILAERDDFAKTANTATQQELQNFQQKLSGEAQELEAYKQQQGQQLAEEGAKATEDIQVRVRNFIKQYNQQKKYTYILETGAGFGNYLLDEDSTLNITQDIVNGLNEQAKQSNN
jgi:outer membrane protein